MLFGRQRRRAADQQQAERFLRNARAERQYIKRRIVQGRSRPAATIGGRVRFGKEGLFAVGQRDDQRVRPVIDRHAELAEAGSPHPVCADYDEGLLTEGTNETD
jgi:hypothetical protein